MYMYITGVCVCVCVSRFFLKKYHSHFCLLGPITVHAFLDLVETIAELDHCAVTVIKISAKMAAFASKYKLLLFVHR